MEDNNVVNQVQPPKTENTWKIATIVLSVVAVVLLCLTIFFAVRGNGNQAENNNVADSGEAVDCPTNVGGNLGNNGEVGTPPATNNYLVIDEWGVRFSVPEGLDNFRYSFYGYEDSVTSAIVVSALDDPAGCRLGRLVRSTDGNAFMSGAFPTSPDYFHDGYYYWIKPLQAACTSPDEEGFEERIHQISLTHQMLRTPPVQ